MPETGASGSVGAPLINQGRYPATAPPYGLPIYSVCSLDPKLDLLLGG
jgi:hypothetical protein